MDIIIERAAPADAEQLIEYLKQVGGETDNLTFGAEGLPFTVEAEAEYLACLQESNDDIMLLAKEGSKIVGSASLNRLPRRMSHRGDIAVSVLKEYWNRGIGKRLIAELVEFAKKNKFAVIDLQVRSDNLGAIHLYEKMGFEKLGTHPAFFKINDAEIPFDYMFLKLR